MKLKDYPPRYVPASIDAGEGDAVSPLFDELERRDLPDGAALERWLEDWSELQSAIGEEGSRRYVAMTCRTEDPAIEKRYLAFEMEFMPKVKPRIQALKQKFLAHPARTRLPKDVYGLFDRHTASEAELFREANVPLEAQDAELGQQYQKLCGAMTVLFDGEERTLPQMGKVLEETDRERRRQAFELISARRLRDRDAVSAIYDAMVELRTRIARNAGYANFRDYAFPARGRFDYTPADCDRYAEAVERCVVPLLRERHERRRRGLGVDRLRPWDLAVDPKGRPPLRPFEGAERLIEGCARIFGKVDPDLGDQFGAIRARGYLDLDSRKGKAPGGYQATFDVERMPFIFMNAAGLQRDVETLLHEGGHAFHAIHCRHHPLAFNRGAPLEFCEVASMSMELLGGEYLDEFLTPEEVRRARAQHLEGLVDLFAWIATIDQFQHWVYTHPGHSREERRAAWLDGKRRFGGADDWSGHEEAMACQWQRQGHLFGSPFYYIEYAIAQIGALQVWQNARRDRRDALRMYREALTLGWTRPLPELFRAAGLRFGFDASILGPLVEAIRKEFED